MWQPHTGKGRRASRGGASWGLGLLRGRGGRLAGCTCPCQVGPFPSSSLRFLRLFLPWHVVATAKNCQTRAYLWAGGCEVRPGPEPRGLEGRLALGPDTQVAAQVQAFPIPAKPPLLSDRGLFYLLKMFVVFSLVFFHSISALNLAPYRGDKLK